MFTKLLIGQAVGDGMEGMMSAGIDAGLKNAKNMGDQSRGMAGDEPMRQVMLPEVQVSASMGEATSVGEITPKGKDKVNRHVEKHSPNE